MIVVCIPAYNEEETIAKVVLLAKKYVGRVIVCDDGSTDLTGEIAEGLGAILVRHEGVVLETRGNVNKIGFLYDVGVL